MTQVRSFGIVEVGLRKDLLGGSLSVALDHFRWIAAFCVCINHVRNLLFPDFGTFGATNIAVRIFYFFTLFATQSVVIFFVISGLLIGGPLLISVFNRTFSVAHYAAARAARLYVALVPAVVLSVILALAGLGGPRCGAEFPTVAANLLFLQNVSAAPLCNNHPLWSLSNEAFYYLLAPLIALTLFTAQRFKPALLLGLTLAVLVFHFKRDHQDILLAMPLWLVGIVPWFVRIRISYLVPALAFVATLVASRLHVLSAFSDDYLVAATFTALLCSRLPDRIVQTGRSLADFSYSLYLVHMPIGLAIAAFVPIQDPNRPTAYAVYAVAIALCVAVAWLFGRLFESRTHRVRGILRSALGGVTRPAPDDARRVSG